MKLAAQERKERIQAEYKRLMLAAAERVICRHGYQSATMDEIAREAEFSKATLYKYELGVWSIRKNSKIQSKRNKFKNKDYWGKKPDD